MNNVETILQSDGKLPAFAWPGGYPILYLMEDGASMCPDCANGENDSEATWNPGIEDAGTGWVIVGYFAHMEGEPEFCCHCNAEIESAYGNPED